MDAIWARLVEAGMPFMLHIGLPATALDKRYSNNGRFQGTSVDAGGEVILSKDMLGIHHAHETFLGAMVLDGVFERFPSLRGGVIEAGAGWVPALLRRLDWIADIWRRSEPELAAFTRKPSQQIIDQMIFTPYAFEDVGALIRDSDNRLYAFSSDYPHVEGGRTPLERFEKSLAASSESDKQRFYTDNFADTFRI